MRGGHARLMLARQRFDEGLLHYPVELVEGIDVGGERIVLDDTAIFLLVAGDDREVAGFQQVGAVDRLARFLVGFSVVVSQAARDAQPNTAVDAAFAKTDFGIGLLVDDLVAEEVSCALGCVCDERLLLGEGQVEIGLEPVGNALLDVLGVGFGTSESNQPVG